MVLIAGIREEALKVLEESGQPVAVVLGIRIGNDLRKGGRLGGAASAARPKAARSASAKKAAATRKARAK